MAETKKFPTKPTMKTYDYDRAGIGGFDENLMRAKDYAQGVDKAMGKKSGYSRGIANKVGEALGKDTANIHKDETQARARIFLAVGDGVKAGKTGKQITDEMVKKYGSKK